MSFDENISGEDLRSDPQISEAVELMVSSSADLLQSTASWSESVVAMGWGDSDPALDDLRRSVETSAAAVNESAQLAPSTVGLDEARSLSESIERACDLGWSSAQQASESFDRLPDEITGQHDAVAGQTTEVAGLFQVVAESSRGWFGWWQRLTDQRPAGP